MCWFVYGVWYNSFYKCIQLGVSMGENCYHEFHSYPPSHAPYKDIRLRCQEAQILNQWKNRKSLHKACHTLHSKYVQQFYSILAESGYNSATHINQLNCTPFCTPKNLSNKEMCIQQCFTISHFLNKICHTLNSYSECDINISYSENGMS